VNQLAGGSRVLQQQQQQDYFVWNINKDYFELHQWNIGDFM
jgi:hypothetical protein